ncbi:uncharacterized protein LOC111252588 [Varroa destructor]|uniref:Uncharacterized protein n=1 Tax=Varroa destructor TaxID=109461 RepID=A0A7M7KNS6_VARDE|nr:uncharacterized protein LOC111252588 [Varroa destructor]
MDGNYQLPRYYSRRDNPDPLRGGDELMAYLVNAANNALHDIYLGHGGDFRCPGSFSIAGPNPRALGFPGSDRPGCYAILGFNPNGGYNSYCATNGGSCSMISNYNSFGSPSSYVTGTYSPSTGYGGPSYVGASNARGSPYQYGVYCGIPFSLAGYIPAPFSSTGFVPNPYGSNVGSNGNYSAIPYGQYFSPYSGVAYRPQPRIFSMPTCGSMGHKNPAHYQSTMEPYTYSFDPNNVQISWQSNPGQLATCMHNAGLRSTCMPGSHLGAQSQPCQSSTSLAVQPCSCENVAHNVCNSTPAAVSQASCPMSLGPQGANPRIQSARTSCAQHGPCRTHSSTCGRCSSSVTESSASSAPADTNPGSAKRTAPVKSEESETSSCNETANPGNLEDCLRPSTPSPAANIPLVDTITITADGTIHRLSNPVDQFADTYRIISVGDFIPVTRLSGSEPILGGAGTFTVPVLCNTGRAPGIYSPITGDVQHQQGPLHVTPGEQPHPPVTPNGMAINPAVIVPASTISGGRTAHSGSTAGATFTPVNFIPAGLFNTVARPGNPPIVNPYSPGFYNPNVDNIGVVPPSSKQNPAAGAG